MYRSTRVLFLVLLLSALALAVSPLKEGARAAVDKRTPLPFEPAEELVYEGEFSRALFRGLNVAELRFTAELIPSSQPAATTKATGEAAPSRLLFKAEAVSKGLLQKLFGFNFRQHIESTVEPDSFSVLQTTKLDQQGSRLRTSEAIFDRQEGKVVWTERDPKNPARAPRVVTSPLKGSSVQDIMSAIYYLRTQTLTPGKNFELAISDSGKVYAVPVRVVEKKRFKTVLGKVQTVRVDPEIFGEGRPLGGRGTMSIWFTDDARHIPVRAHINNEIGTIDITLKKATTGKIENPR
ncbi:MAG TPA: DUF3108 domain-containing protein [Pyrinomonadaceae bacterium]|jgi:hypothetical protein|nr:DUF3108 domain-containing protein [Pyrinomonadaceae bacterium]